MRADVARARLHEGATIADLAFELQYSDECRTAGQHHMNDRVSDTDAVVGGGLLLEAVHGAPLVA